MLWVLLHKIASQNQEICTGNDFWKMGTFKKILKTVPTLLIHNAKILQKGIGIVNYEYIHKWHLAENLNKIILHMIVRKGPTEIVTICIIIYFLFGAVTSCVPIIYHFNFPN